MKHTDFPLGGRVRFNRRTKDLEGIVIGYMIKTKELMVSYESDHHNESILGSHVDIHFYTDIYKWVENVEDYHNKPHAIFQPAELTLISAQVKAQVNTGCNCSVCGIPNPYAEPNQPDSTFKCYSCRSNPLRSYC